MATITTEFMTILNQKVQKINLAGISVSYLLDALWLTTNYISFVKLNPSSYFMSRVDVGGVGGGGAVAQLV